MILRLFLIILSIGCSQVMAQTAISLRFGSTTLNAEDYLTVGTALQVQGETFLQEDYGIIFSVGQSNSKTTSNVNQNGSSKPKLEVTNTFLNVGSFYYITKPLRVSAGLSTNSMNLKSSDSVETTSLSTNLVGPFASISYMLRINHMAVGLEYFYSHFGEFSQSNLILILGVAF